jgi:hypothetical protein
MGELLPWNFWHCRAARWRISSGSNRFLAKKDQKGPGPSLGLTKLGPVRGVAEGVGVSSMATVAAGDLLGLSYSDFGDILVAFVLEPRGCKQRNDRTGEDE